MHSGKLTTSVYLTHRAQALARRQHAYLLTGLQLLSDYTAVALVHYTNLGMLRSQTWVCGAG